MCTSFWIKASAESMNVIVKKRDKVMFLSLALDGFDSNSKGVLPVSC